jgi:putative cell wall-binding protein
MNTVILNTDSGADIRLIVELAQKLNIDVLSLSEKEVEEIEELKLIHIMQKAREEGLADRKKTLEKLGL